MSAVGPESTLESSVLLPLGGTAITDIAVVVPARNEQQSLGACLTSIRVAGDYLRLRAPHISQQVVVVLDDCDDGSADIVAKFEEVQAISVSLRNVGAARQAGVDALLSEANRHSDQVWLASTDADCRLPERWLFNFVTAAAEGYHVVLGMVRPGGGLSAFEHRAWSRHHKYVDGHPHVHGANMGLRADVHSMLGGWAALPTGEDVDLAARAGRRHDVRILRTGRDPVLTSTRRKGRAPAGFADYLNTLASGVNS